MPTISVCLTFDVDAMSVWIGTMKTKNISAISRGEFTVLGTSRVLEFLKHKNIRASFFVPGHTAYAFPDLIKRIRDEGHEIGHHGWVHENPAELDVEHEIEVLENGLEALHRTAGVRPVGYRSPAWDFSERSLSLLKEYGFVYDSSLLGSDFIPYYPRTGDRFGPDEPYRFGEVLDLVELPGHWSLDDFVAFETIVGLLPGNVPPRQIEEMWRDDFDFAAQECQGGVFIPTMHPQCIGRGSRLRMVERLVDHMRDTSDVAFVTMESYARSWRSANPIDTWKVANPLRTGVNAITDIKVALKRGA
jgi:peptidoglycan/xylan/chitin deacetylase (PgdA/CDA1 family)